MMKYFLKGADGTLFPLILKVTTVGRENCDFTIQQPGLDYQHCIIEYSENDDCFVIQDLNTGQGTYVNDVRVQNAAVRLAPGDTIRFGYNGQPFQLQVDNQTQMTIPPVSQRPAVWNQPITVLTDQDIYASNTSSPYGASHALPLISFSNTSIQPSVTWTSSTSQQPTPPVPRPPLRSRPLSAGASRRNVQNIPVGPSLTKPSSVVGGWMNQPLSRATSIPDLQEKDQKINQLNEEVARLRSLEFESFHKDTFIQQLQQQVGDLQNKLIQEPSVIMGGDFDMSAKLLHLETEINTKKGEIVALREQLNKLQNDRSNSPALLRQELGERVKEIAQLRNELERVKKDKSIISGLVTQMQRDLSNKTMGTCLQELADKDNTISKLNREIEVLKKDIREREIQMSAATTTRDIHVPLYLGLKGGQGNISPSKSLEEFSARDKELASLRQKFKSAENKVQEQLDMITALQDELGKTKTLLLIEKDLQRKTHTDLDTAKSQILDIQRSERVVRIDLEQLQKRLERFRNKVIQVTFSTSAVTVHEKETSDDELIESLKKLVEERASLVQKIKSLESDVDSAKADNVGLLDQANSLKEVLQSSVKRLNENGRLGASLQQEMNIIQSVSADASLTWICDLIIALFNGELSWENKIEDALSKSGINVKITNEDPSHHIKILHAKWETSLSDIERLRSQITLLGEAHKEELARNLTNLTTEWEDRLKDAVEKAKLEGDEKLNRVIDEIRAVETEKRESCVEAERRKISELQDSIVLLRQSLAERQADDQARLEEAKLALQELESLRMAETDLKNQLVKLEELRVEDASKFSADKEELTKKFEAGLASYKEQIKQHSVTICSMEERVEKLMKKNKDYQEQLSKLRAEKSKPLPPPKPKIIIQRPREELVALEHVVTALRQENTVLKKEIRDSQDIILGLRRDLAGASARLSDITGEMSEGQKQEVERNRELLTQKGSELTELRQQMAKLSKIIDSQKEEIKKLEGELSKEKCTSSRYKIGLEENSSQLKVLEEELSREKEEQKKQLDLIDQEGQIASELTSLGAQCRGERHEQIILKQREALVELRAKVKALEQTRPPLLTQDQAFHQLALLKKEMAEMRANQALGEDKIVSGTTSLDREIGRARGLIVPTIIETDMERSAHRETMDALECSEASFLTLLRAMAASLDIEEIDGLHSMAHIPRDEREALVQAREKACQILANRIQVLKERITRKDELLQDYENDLAKFRHSQEVAERKVQQVDMLTNDVRSRSEESHYLRESLNRTRDKLNQEKRLNSAIKQRKTFHLENERAHMHNNYRGHHCPIEDPRVTVKKRQHKELLKRKNYEIKTLKDDLCETEKELHAREKRLMSLETNLGVERSRKFVEV